jgi:antitoxin YefM
MDSITYTTARANLAATMDRVCEDHEPVVVTRNEQSVVMMSLEDYNALEETAYLLRSPKNAMRLLEGIAALEAGRGKVRKLLK